MRQRRFKSGIECAKYSLDYETPIGSSFDIRQGLLSMLLQASIESSLTYCKKLTEDDLGGSDVDWRDSDAILTAFLDDPQMMQSWSRLVRSKLRRWINRPY